MMHRPLSKIALVAFLLCLFSGHIAAQDLDFEASVHNLEGEDYLYSIDFLFFANLAEGRLRFAETDRRGVYLAELAGRTLGFVSWLTGKRTQTYTSTMEISPDGSLRSMEYLARIDKLRWGKRQTRLERYRYDYALGKVFEEKILDGVPLTLEVLEIPEGMHPVDMLTAFYNLRSGAYGTPAPGTHLLIPTCSGGKFTEIEVEVLAAVDPLLQKYFPENGLLVKVNLDPDIFDTKDGNLYVWFDEGGIPRRGILKNFAGIGDVRGHLSEEDL
jgi:hypothetical protein